MSPCDPVLGALTRLDDRSLSATIGLARQQIPVRIDPDGDPAEGTLANARALAETISEMDRRARQSAAADLLNEYNESWREWSEADASGASVDRAGPRLTAQQLANRLQLTSAEVLGLDCWELGYDAGCLFAGHSVFVISFDQGTSWAASLFG